MEFDNKDFEKLETLIYKTFNRCFAEQQNKDFETKIYNISQTGKLIGKTYNFVSNLLKSGYLQTTADGKHITGKEINRYLGECKTDKKTVTKIDLETV